MTRAPSGAERIEQWLGPAGEAYHIIKPIVEFLAHPLDEVTGDPEQLRTKAEAWRTAATKLGDMATSEELARAKVLAAWEGPAASAFAAEMTEITASLREAADHFRGTAELLDVAAEGAQEAQDLVEQIVRELIAWLIITIIVALASSWITAGASVVAGAGAGAAEAAVAAGRAARVAAQLAKLLRQAQAFLKRMSEFAKTYKLTKIHKVGVNKWATARYASADGYKLIATNTVIKKTMVEPTLGGPIRHVTGADKGIEWPQVL
ncbi:WXG100 family type VII secretion target [Planosporangium sp. 12N6]|uniref:WXG100 family type VII secretion target n=1 Tax=Planosporangium spinosum TaxID=3402278 RepID=UPI003CF67000